MYWLAAAKGIFFISLSRFAYVYVRPGRRMQDWALLIFASSILCFAESLDFYRAKPGFGSRFVDTKRRIAFPSSLRAALEKNFCVKGATIVEKYSLILQELC